MNQKEPTLLKQVRIDNEIFYQISDVDKMRPFFITLLSDANHWMFLGSNGGLTAGRKDADQALFPYYTDDKIIESAEITGSKTILRLPVNGKPTIWEPFSVRFAHQYRLERNLYKNIYGNKIIFEETNHDVGLTFQYQWSNSDAYGFVKTSRLINTNGKEVSLSLVDGIQNILPHGVGSALQSQRSNLVDAYKRNELDKESGVGIYSLSAIIVDKPEPSEALKATVAWSIGLKNITLLLSSLQLDRFRQGEPIEEEEDIKAEKGSYFIHTHLTLEAKSKKEWMIVADVKQSAAQIVSIAKAIATDKHLYYRIKEDVEAGTNNLVQLNAAADGLQLTADRQRDTRHFFNSMFNIMRGGVFDNNYQIEKKDFKSYLAKANRQVAESHNGKIEKLANAFSLTALKEFAEKSDDNNFKRLAIEYLPLKFSRRHGDPSRPWNQFSINTRNEVDGSKVLDYAGNWRDIFQNWEALAHSYPQFIDGMIFKFLNASTVDGYNPYRITKHGIDWERIEADDPWSFIGYWGDHQIIYLLKFLEFAENHAPGKLASYFSEDIFVYANVPYKIKRYEDILRNPKDTIDFDRKLDHAIQQRWATLGADSALLQNKSGAIHHVNFLEKILASVLAKLSNFIPEGGIWMNTQRPEWNDANNALVGNGVSMVTLYYLRRFLTFLNEIIESNKVEEVKISEELFDFFVQCRDTFRQHQHLLSAPISNKDRKTILDGLGSAGSAYRTKIYSQQFTDERKKITRKELVEFSKLTLRYLDHTIRANKRNDNMFHAYNLMTVENNHEISISPLSEMLEGQVAVLSSGYLNSREALDTLNALKASKLFREDQNSYVLYPNKQLPGFLEKNNIAKADVAKSSLLTHLLKDGNTQIVERDANGGFHFNGNFKNAADLRSALDNLEQKNNSLTDNDKNVVLAIFEKIFNHKAFTGRSGTFFGYEGLGSIYWHMVSKLQLAVQECYVKAVRANENDTLISQLQNHYYQISEGIGVHKSPTHYGAFPTDPYSHTPANKGAQQPGMTGQVKEDIISRFGELGVFVEKGELHFHPHLLKRSEFLTKKQVFNYIDVNGNAIELPIGENSLCFTYCQTPVVYKIANENSVEIVSRKGIATSNELKLDTTLSQKVFSRNGEISRIDVHIARESLL